MLQMDVLNNLPKILARYLRRILIIESLPVLYLSTKSMREDSGNVRSFSLTSVPGKLRILFWQLLKGI